MSAIPQKKTGRGKGRARVSSTNQFMKAIGLLIAVALISVGSTQVDLGPLNAAVGILMALVQAVLIVAVFMRLLYNRKSNEQTLALGLLLVGLFFVFSVTGLLNYGRSSTQRGAQAAAQKLELMTRFAGSGDAKQGYPKPKVTEDHPTVAEERENPPPPPPPPSEEPEEVADAQAGSKPAFKLDPAKVEEGKSLFTSKTCMACHSIDGSRLVGPSLKGYWGAKIKLASGDEIVGDHDYFVESIKEPNAKVHDGFPPAMPPGLVTDDDEIEALLHYINSL